MENFRSLGLPEALLTSLQGMEFHTPTPIQAQTIPSALQGSDILGSAQTGTGKTAAFGIPLVSYLLANPEASALVLTPTRELACQVHDALKKMVGKKSAIRTTLLIGGEPMFKQCKQLEGSPKLIVGTPGRINDHLERRTLKLDAAGFLVLDETDRMLDMGFSVQIERIVAYLPKVRQTLMFSATLAPEIVKMADTYLKNAIRVSVGSVSAPVEKIAQEIVHTTENEKYGLLLERIAKESGSLVVFVKTKYGTEKLATKLRKDGHEAEAIHGDLRQNKRTRVLTSFRQNKSRILVATDVAARGLDIPHIECVVNYDLPESPEDYIHRIGRTGRAGAEGKAVSFITEQDGFKWRSICRLLNPKEKGAAVRPDNITVTGEPHKREGGFESRRPRFQRDFSSKPRFGGGDDRPKRFFGDDRPPRPEGDRPRRFDGDRPARPEGDRPRRFDGDRPARPFGDRPPRTFGADRPARPEGDRPRRFDGDRPARPFGDRPPRFEGDRPRRFDGDRPARPFGDRPPRPEGDRPRRFDGDRPTRPFGDRPPRPEGDRPRRFDGDRPARPFGDRPPRPFDRFSSRPAGDSPRPERTGDSFSRFPKSRDDRGGQGRDGQRPPHFSRYSNADRPQGIPRGDRAFGGAQAPFRRNNKRKDNAENAVSVVE